MSAKGLLEEANQLRCHEGSFDSFFDDGSPRHPTLAAALKALGEP